MQSVDIEKIQTFLDNFNYSTKFRYSSCYILIGYTQTGKTTNVNNLLKDYNIKNISECYSSKELRDLLHKAFVSNLVKEISYTNQKDCILIDNLDVLVELDNNTFGTLLRTLELCVNYKNIPIICIITLSKFLSLNSSFNELIKKCSFHKIECDVLLFKSKDVHIMYFLNLLEDYKFNLLASKENKIIHYLITLKTFMIYTKIIEYTHINSDSLIETLYNLRTNKLKSRKKKTEIESNNKIINQKQKSLINKKSNTYPFNEINKYHIARFFLTEK
jgi:hypothetical protein